MSMMIATGAVLAYGGLASLSFTMDRHYADLHGRGMEPNGQTRMRFRMLGWTGIAFSFLACIAANGWHTGPVLWCGVLTTSAIVLTLLLQYAPHKAIRLAKIGYLTVPILAAVSILMR